MLHLIVMNVLCIGYIALMYLVYRVFKLVREFVRPAKDLSLFGTWTVVTGGTDGIGKAICFELASKGQNVLIVGRNPQKLKNTISEISKKYPSVQLDSIQIDLSKFDEEAQSRYKSAIESKAVGILINNAGVSYNFVNYLDEVPQGRIENIMKVNNYASTLIMYITLKEFLRKKQIGIIDELKGAIVNISSTHSVIPCELHSVYSATKTYLNKLTLDLGDEYNKKGITFQVQLPHFVCSKMSKVRKPSFTTPTAEDFAKYSVKQIGYKGLIYPYPIHAIMFFIVSLIPTKLLRYYVSNFHHKIRFYGKKKMERKLKKQKEEEERKRLNNLGDNNMNEQNRVKKMIN